MNFKDQRNQKSEDNYDIQFPAHNAYEQSYSDAAGSKSYQTHNKFDDYPSQNYTDFSKTDHFFQDQRLEPTNHQTIFPNYQTNSSFFTQNDIKQSDKSLKLLPNYNSSHKSDNQTVQSSISSFQESSNNLTINQILNLQKTRQQQLKTLSEEDFKQSAEFQFFQSRTDVSWKLSIADYYENVVPNKDFNQWIRKTRRSSQYRQIAFWGLFSAITPFYFAAKMNYLPKFFTKNTKYFPLIPVFGFWLAMHFEEKQNQKSLQFLKQVQNQQIMNSLMRRYLCDTTPMERFDVYRSK